MDDAIQVFLGILLLITTGWLLKLLDFNLFLILCMLSLILILSIIKGKSSKFKTITSVIFSAIFITTSILVIDKKSAVWEQFNESDIISYVNSGEIVLLDVTADWCITCQMNKITTLNSGRIVKIFRENNIKLQRADWTERDPHILEFISKYGRYGIPVNIIYSKNNTEGILLPEILSQDILREELRKVINEN